MGEQGLVLWLLRLAAQHRLERQSWIGEGGLAEGTRADRDQRRGSDLIPDVSLSVRSWAALLTSPALIFSSTKRCLEGQCGGHKIVMGVSALGKEWHRGT